jgi:subtilase family serine protease
MKRTARRQRSRTGFRPTAPERCESRELLSTLSIHLPHRAHADVLRVDAQHGVKQHVAVTHEHPLFKINSHVHRHAGGGPPTGALTPAEIRHIYSIDAITDLGAGQTIAIVDAYDDPNINADADTFDKQFMTTLSGTTSLYSAYGASSTWLTKDYAQGKKPAGNAGWDLEISLDVEWMHSIAPMAKIMLVETASTSYANLLGGDTYAATHGATVVSNSWGGSESSNEASAYDKTFTGYTGVTFVFSAGDSGVQEYPAESPNVLAVGGTTLSHDASYNWSAETGWADGGGGKSAYESSPSYQSGLGYTKRAAPDVSYDGDPNSGFAVYDSVRYEGASGWWQVGGTSAGAPQWSALLALANQGRVAAGKGTLSGITQTLPAIYALSTGTDGSEALYDVTSGKNGVGSAGPGFDLVTGRGSPRRSDLVFQSLVSA